MTKMDTRRLWSQASLRKALLGFNVIDRIMSRYGPEVLERHSGENVVFVEGLV